MSYDPEAAALTSYLKFWGTRGSVPVSGASYVAYGGDTCCLEIRTPERVIIIDAGTGIRSLGLQLLAEGIREIHLFLGHTHWDHIMGFPFFAPVHHPDTKLHVYAFPGEGASLEEKLNTVLDPAYFPIGLGKLRSHLYFHTLSGNDCLKLGEIEICSAPANHPGGAIGFLIKKGDRRVGYVTDNEVLEGYFGPPSDIDQKSPLFANQLALMKLLEGCDPLIHEAQYRPREYRERIGWGHSSIPNATRFAQLCKVHSWVVTHHDPQDSDEDIRRKQRLHQKVLADLHYDCRVQMAFDGLMLPL